jgi:hypothetical protein
MMLKEMLMKNFVVSGNSLPVQVVKVRFDEDRTLIGRLKVN